MPYASQTTCRACRRTIVRGEGYYAFSVEHGRTVAGSARVVQEGNVAIARPPALGMLERTLIAQALAPGRPPRVRLLPDGPLLQGHVGQVLHNLARAPAKWDQGGMLRSPACLRSKCHAWRVGTR